MACNRHVDGASQAVILRTAFPPPHKAMHMPCREHLVETVHLDP